MNRVTIGESTLKDYGISINEAADILNKGKVAFDNSIPDKTLQVLPYTGQAGVLIPSKIGNLDDLTTTAKDNLVNAINEVNGNTIKFINNFINWTVGPSGDFTTLSEALCEAYRYRPIPQIGLQWIVHITIKANYDLSAQGLDITNIDLGFVYITFESQITDVNTSWLWFLNSVAPFIDLNVSSNVGINHLLNYINSTGILSMNGSYSQGILAEKGSNVIINSGTINCNDSDADNFIEVRTGANVSVSREVIFSGAKSTGTIFKLSHGSSVIVQGNMPILTRLSGNSSFLEADNMSFFCIEAESIYSTSTNPVFQVTKGSYGVCNVSMVGTAPEANIPFNQVTANGIIFKN